MWGRGWRIYLFIHEYDVFMRKNTLKTTEMSGQRAKMRHFPYIKQNSIAETQSTMESFLARKAEKDTPGINKKNRFYKIIVRVYISS